MVQARAQVLADLQELERRRRRAVIGTAVAFGIVATAAGMGRPSVLAALLALDLAAVLALAAGLGVLGKSTKWLALVGITSGVCAAVSVALLQGQGGPASTFGAACLAEGGLAGALAAGALTVSLAPLLRRASDVRWAIAMAGGAAGMAMLAFACPRHDALHLWATHLTVLPAAYLLARLAFGAALPHDR